MEGTVAGVDFVEGSLSRGFCFPAANLVVLSAAELFGRFAVHPRRLLRLRRAERHRAQIDFSELAEGDLVVHLEHGIGRFLGLEKFPVGQAHRLPDSGPASMATPKAFGIALQQRAQPQEVLVLEFADEAKLYVPLEQAYLVSRYVGAGKKSPPLSSLGDGKWSRAKIKAAASIFDYAGKMLAIQAERQMQPGYAFTPDTKWQAEFERSFPFRETPDQMKAIIDTKIDMERPRPMDRLICGDVGFGKTEVAVRAAFKTVMEGKQVAVLAPTTVLAQQHFEVFRQRMREYPVRIEMLSRFRSHSEQKKVLQLLREGGVDIVIGTHRLISGDVVFRDLGQVVIDEEQRFGVLHKEKFKELFKLVDVLTLSATPIPRTLYLSLVGVKDMSTIETPPPNRLPVETVVSAYDERIIRAAIDRELERQGQVFFLHNRIASIERMRERIGHLCPQARVEIGHGQMDADELEAVMARFIAGKDRRARLHDDHRKRSRYSECKHNNHRSRGSIWSRGFVPIARARRSGRAQGVCLPASATGNDDSRCRAEADQCDQAIQLVRRWVSHRHARSGDSRRGQHSRHRAERPHHNRGFRFVLPVAQAGSGAVERTKTTTPAGCGRAP